jgi:hypothetical protein
VVTESTKRQIRLSERDLTILREHLPRFRITTYEALYRLFFEPKGKKMNAVKSLIRRLREGGYLDSCELPGETRKLAYFLTEHAVSQLKITPLSLSKPPPAGQLPTLFGGLAFACLGESQLRKIAATEFEQQFPELAANDLPTDIYYLDRDYEDEKYPAQKRLGIICIDTNNSLRRLLQVVHERIKMRIKIDAWKKDVIRKDRLLITVLTMDEDKAKQIREALKKEASHDVPVRVVVRKQLRDVLPQGPRA